MCVCMCVFVCECACECASVCVCVCIVPFSISSVFVDYKCNLLVAYVVAGSTYSFKLDLL